MPSIVIGEGKRRPCDQMWNCSPGRKACPFKIDPSPGHDESLKSLMMDWYYDGYYTGLYEGQQHANQAEPKS